MAKTIVGLYETITAARKIVSDLQDSGVPREDISLVASDSRGEFARYFDTREELTSDERDRDIEDEVVSDAGEGAARGAGAGAVLGGVAGLLVGLGLLAIPGIGPVVAAGPIVSALAGAGIGAATGGLVGALVKAGVPEHEAEHYAEGVRRGGALVSVNAPDDMIEQVNEIMSRYNPINVREPAVESRTMSERATDAAIGHDDMTRANEDFTAGDVNVGARSNRAQVAGTRPAEHAGVRAHTETDDRVVGAGSGLYTSQGYADRDDVQAGTLPQATAPQGAYGGTQFAGRDFDTYEDDFREHYEQHYGTSDYAYEQFMPAYRYGYDLGVNERYRDYDWDRIETEARRDWESRYPASAWEDFKDAIREGWECVRGRR